MVSFSNKIVKEVIASSPDEATRYQGVTYKEVCKRSYNKKNTAKRIHLIHEAECYPDKQQRKVEEIAQQQAVWEQSMIEKIQALPSKYSFLKSLDPSIITARLESLFLFGVNVREAQSPLQVASAIGLLFRTMMDKSLIEEVYVKLRPYIESAFGFNVFSAQSEQLESQAESSWLMSLREVSTNWQNITSNASFSKISNLISMAAAIGLCDLANFKLDINGMRMFSIGAKVKHVSAIDFAGACLDTTIYFVEGAYKCFQAKSFMPLVFTEDNAREFDSKYNDVTEIWAHAKVGNLNARPHMFNGVKDLITDNDLSVILDELIGLAEDILRSSPKGWERKYVNDRLLTLRKMRADWQTLRVNGKLRQAPFGFHISGPSSIGKSTVSDILMRTALNFAGADASDNRIVSIKASDKYDSNVTAGVNGFVLDDLGNTKPEYEQESPCRRIIDLNNNVPVYANMAEAELKGKISLAPVVLCSTSNEWMADTARKYSIEWYSIVRRFNLHIRPNVKPEFRYTSNDPSLNTTAVMRSPEGDKLIPELWNFDVFVPSAIDKSKGLKAVHMGISFEKLVKYTRELVVEHFNNQARFIASSQNLAEKLNFCDGCKLPAHMCDCGQENTRVGTCWEGNSLFCDKCTKPHTECLCTAQQQSDTLSDSSDDESLDGIEIIPVQRIYSVKPREEIMEDLRSLPVKTAKRVQGICQERKQEIISYLDDIDKRNFHLSNYIPDCIMYSRFVKAYHLFRNRNEFHTYERDVRTWSLLFVGLSFAGAFASYDKPHLSCAFLLSNFLIFMNYVRLLAAWKTQCIARLAQDRDFTPYIFERFRAIDAKKLCAVSLVMAGIYKFCFSTRTLETAMAQSELQPKDQKEIEDRDQQINPWANAVVNELHVTDKSKTMTYDQLYSKVKKSLCHVQCVKGDKTVECNALFVRTHFAIFPAHTVQNCTFKALFTKYDTDSNGATFRVNIDSRHMVLLLSADLVLVYVPAGGSFPNLVPYFPLNDLPNFSGNLCYRNPCGECIESKIYGRYKKDVKTTAGIFKGHQYQLTFETFSGLCGAPLVANARHPVIGGVHLGGYDDTHAGCSGQILRDQVIEAIDYLSRQSSVFDGVCNGTIPTQKYDIQFYEKPDVHFKSPINYLPKGNNIDYFGQVKGRATYTKSEVSPTIISDIVEEVTGVPQKHGPPAFHRWKPWQASLEHSSNPSPGVEQENLDWAIEDYISDLSDLIQDPKFNWRKEIRPLTEMETVCGRDGCRFIDKMPPNTSVGYPEGGPKKDHLTILDPNEHPDFNNPLELDQKYWDEARRMEECYLNDERAYPIFKACLKDEATKIGKDKVRVFQASEIAFQLLVRKYYLPIARFLSMNPIVAECAVGINAQGPEWVELMDWVTKYGEDRIVAGDYSKYDLRMSAQLTMSAMKIYIRLAKITGNYTPRDLQIMKGIATDVVYPVTAYNGDLLMLKGTVPSGFNLTVYLNCTCNSLLHRSAFYDLANVDVCNHRKYRDYVASIFYGDDAESSSRLDDFNHISYANWLKKRDIVFTMPDKTSDPVKFMNVFDVDFLKRQHKYIPELDTYVGALDEESIFKSLHSVVKSKSITAEEQAAQNIDGALREWFCHGHEMYEKRREQMRQVAEKAGIEHITRELNVSFAQRMINYREKYLGEGPTTFTSEEEVAKQQSEWVEMPDHSFVVESGCENFRIYMAEPFLRFWWEPYLYWMSDVNLVIAILIQAYMIRNQYYFVPNVPRFHYIYVLLFLPCCSDVKATILYYIRFWLVWNMFSLPTAHFLDFRKFDWIYYKNLVFRSKRQRYRARIRSQKRRIQDIEDRFFWKEYRKRRRYRRQNAFSE